MWAGSELRGERGATGERRVQAPLASADRGRGAFFRQKCRRFGGLLRERSSRVAGPTRRPASDRETGLNSPEKNASSGRRPGTRWRQGFFRCLARGRAPVGGGAVRAPAAIISCFQIPREKLTV